MAAFEALVRRYQPRLLAFLVRRVGNRQDAEDVTQRTFVKIHSSIGAYRDEYPFHAWAFMIARRQAVDLLRGNYSRRRLQTHLETYSPDAADTGPEPGETLEQHEQAEKLWELARKHLSERAFSALWLRVQEDMDDEEIGRALRVSRTHARVLLHRARHKLARLQEVSAASSPCYRRAHPRPTPTYDC